MSLKVPEKCLVCGAPYHGGGAPPGEPMIEGARVFYRCGASMSYLAGNVEGVYRILFKNCQNDEGAEKNPNVPEQIRKDRAESWPKE